MKIEVDVLIFGGGIAGLWTVDEVHRRGYAALLLESAALGSGQTIASQGILHGGLKYSLGGLVDSSSKAVAEMPTRWAASLRGEATPDLRNVRVLSSCCYLWRTASFASRVGLFAAQAVIRTPIEKVSPGDRPEALRDCPGEVLRVEEPVLDMTSLLDCFGSAHSSRMALYAKESLALSHNGDGVNGRAKLAASQSELEFRARTVIFCAGEGNADLRRNAGLTGEVMQTRPLHMVMVRGNLPELFGHCVDANKTRATITTATDPLGRNVWVVGGEIAEKGVERDDSEQIAFAREELHQVLPGVDFTDTQWATYRIQRAEGRTPGNRRPEAAVWRQENSIITAWPTKLVLAPQLAREITNSLPKPTREEPVVLPSTWVRPSVAQPPWEACQAWTP